VLPTASDRWRPSRSALHVHGAAFGRMGSDHHCVSCQPDAWFHIRHLRTQFNGLSQADALETRNRRDELSSGADHKSVDQPRFLCRTHDHSTMAVATGSAIVSTNFDVPSGMETGPSSLEVLLTHCFRKCQRHRQRIVRRRLVQLPAGTERAPRSGSTRGPIDRRQLQVGQNRYGEREPEHGAAPNKLS